MRVFDVSSRVIGGVAALAGLAAAAHYARAGLTLSHYDAKAHLVVARRIFDSITPGWEQIGAVWLPLPHLINALPVQIDVLYRTGAFATLLSVAFFALAAAALSGTVATVTRSASGSALTALLLITNPNLLYLQSTPMTEPMLFGLTALATLLMTQWVMAEGEPTVPRTAGWVMVAACLTRYEAWPIAGALVALSAIARWRAGTPVAVVAPVIWRLTWYPIGAVLFFLMLSRATVGEWFVSGGFYVPDETLRGQPWHVVETMVEGTIALSSPRIIGIGALAIVGVVLAGLVSRTTPAALVSLGLLAAAALPFTAFVSGHPFRIRYEVPLVFAMALVIGMGAGLCRLAAPLVTAAVVVVAAIPLQPFDAAAPMVVEAQVDRQQREGRQQVTRCLVRGYRGETIFASMGSLAHYMQELSHEGFHIRDFLHEGNHPIWDAALDHGPAPFTGWVLVEEVAEGGDMLALRQRENPDFLNGYDRVCEGGNVALYRRR